MYKCEDCENIFEEPETQRVCMEVEYGVSDLFPSGTWNYEYMGFCPFCGGINIEEKDDEDEEN